MTTHTPYARQNTNTQQTRMHAARRLRQTMWAHENTQQKRTHAARHLRQTTWATAEEIQ